MPLFLITYDLIRPEKDYPDLINTLRNMGARRVLHSTWMIRSAVQGSDVFDRIWIGGSLDKKDRLLVVEVTGWKTSENMNINTKGL